MTKSKSSRAFASARRAAAAWGRSIARYERFWIGLGIGGVAIVLACFAAIHVIVASHRLRDWVNTDPEQLLLDYDAASSWVPGVIHLRGLSMRGSDENVQWFFRIEDATISISLLDLARKQFHATSVRAIGLVFRLREKEDSNELSVAHLARLPEIAGFPDPPLRLGGRRPPPPPPEARKRFWSIRIENLLADPTPDIWVEIYRFRGHARITGGFFLHPHLEARVGPAMVRFLSGDLALAPDQPILASASGRADCSIEPYDPDGVSGPEVWREISGSIQLEGGLRDLRFLNHFLRHSPEPRLEGGGGRARGLLHITRGIGRGATAFETSEVSARYAKATLEGRASGTLEIPRWDLVHDKMEISGSRVALDDIATAGTPRDEIHWWGRFDIPNGSIADGLTALTSIQCRDARPLYAALGADLPAWAQRILKLENVHAKARVRLTGDLIDVEDLEGAGGKFQFAGRYRQERQDRDGAFLLDTGPLAVGVAIDGSSSRVKLVGARKWFEGQRTKSSGLASTDPRP